MSLFQNAQKVLRENIREYGMYIALFVIMAIFTVTTKGGYWAVRLISLPRIEEMAFARTPVKATIYPSDWARGMLRGEKYITAPAEASTRPTH